MPLDVLPVSLVSADRQPVKRELKQSTIDTSPKTSFIDILQQHLGVNLIELSLPSKPDIPTGQVSRTIRDLVEVVVLPTIIEGDFKVVSAKDQISEEAA